MKSPPKRISVAALLFISFTLLAVLIAAGIGRYVLNRDRERFELEAAQMRRDHIHSQRTLIKNEVDRVVTFAQFQWSKAEERLKETVKARTEEACKMGEGLYRQCTHRMSPAEAVEVIRDTLRPIRYSGGRGYYFALTMDGRCLLFGDHPEVEGQNLIDIQDSQGAFITRDLVDLVKRSGEGFYYYTWSKPGVTGKDFPKISYVKYFAPFNGFIGTGEYIDDVEKEIQQEVLEWIGKIRYGNGNYIFAVNYDGVTLMNSFQPEFIGRSMWEMTDARGVKVIQEERRMADRPEGGFIRYHWEEPTTGKIALKTSYIRGFPQWRWMIGTGVYLDEVESVIAARESAARNDLHRDTMAFLLILVLTLGIIVFFSYSLSRYFSREFKVFFEFFRKVERGGYLPVATDQLHLKEFQRLGESANTMLAMRKQAETELRESRERLNSLYENMAEGVALHELVLNERNEPVNYRLVDCNSKYEALLDIHRETAIGRLATENYGMSELPHLEQYAEVALTHVPMRLQTYFSPKNCYLDISATPWGKHGFATIFTDITERKRFEEHQKQLEEQLAQALKMESIGRLAGGVAHDFNNMLTPILGYAEILSLDLSTDDPRRGELEQIILAAKRARDLTRQLLAFARKQTLAMSPLDLNSVIGGIEKMLRRTLRENVLIETHFAPAPCEMTGDRVQIEQVILNLAVNAQDAMKDGGKLVIETATVWLDESYAANRPEVSTGPHVMLAISDTGSGMDRETLARIFDPFFTTKELGRGTGLGLSAVYGIVKQHRGHIWAYSEPGRGTTFRIYFPSGIDKDAPEASEEASGKMEVVFFQGNETILVVEDEEQVRVMACDMLKRYGYTVIEAEDGKSALLKAKAHDGPIDLLITDVVMPDLNGRQLYERLSSMRRNLRVLFMSGYTENAIAHHGVLDAGVNYIQKPFAVETVLRLVRNVLEASPGEASR